MQGVENSKNCCDILNCCIYRDLFSILLKLLLENFDDLLDISCRYTISCRTPLHICYGIKQGDV